MAVSPSLVFTQIMSIPLKLNIQGSGSKTENIKESYKMYAPPAYIESAGTKEEQSALFTIDVKKVSQNLKIACIF